MELDDLFIPGADLSQDGFRLEESEENGFLLLRVVFRMGNEISMLYAPREVFRMPVDSANAVRRDLVRELLRPGLLCINAGLPADDIMAVTATLRELAGAVAPTMPLLGVIGGVSPQLLWKAGEDKYLRVVDDDFQDELDGAALERFLGENPGSGFVPSSIGGHHGS